MNKNKYVIVSEGTTLERPSEPYIGYQYWNTDKNRLEVYRDNIWKNVYNTPTKDVLEGNSYMLEVSEDTVVTMGGVNISSMITDGVLTVNNVTGDIEISDSNVESYDL